QAHAGVPMHLATLVHTLAIPIGGVAPTPRRRAARVGPAPVFSAPPPRLFPWVDSLPYADCPQSRLPSPRSRARAEARYRELLEREGRARRPAEDRRRAARPALAASAGRGARPRSLERSLLPRPAAGFLRPRGRGPPAIRLGGRAGGSRHLLRHGAGRAAGRSRRHR